VSESLSRDSSRGGSSSHNDGAEFARQIGMLPARGSRADRAMLATFNTATRAKTMARAAVDRR
jgi:hypothetical protein